MKKAIFAFSADPIHYGHISVIEKAAKKYDELTVAIGANPFKDYLFSLDERLDMVKKSLEHLKNTKITAFKGLLVDFAYENNIPIIIKAFRNKDDFLYEKSLEQAGKTQKLNIKTRILKEKKEFRYIGSSIIKSLILEQGDVHNLVPINVKQKLEKKILNQYIIGITGEIGSGKTYFCKKLLELCKKNKIKAHIIELDSIGNQILTLKEPRYYKVRKEIVKTFGKEILINGEISRKKLGNLVFNNNSNLKKLNKIMKKPMQVRLRRELYGKKGIIFFNAALIAELGLSHIANNNIILIKADKETQIKRLKQRNLTDKQIRLRLESQFSFNKKLEFLKQNISKDNSGKLWILDNESKINKIFNEFA